MQLHGPKAILMGDAAHAMWPSLGQGSNCALESAVVLGEVLEDCKASRVRICYPATLPGCLLPLASVCVCDCVCAGSKPHPTL